MKSEMWQRLRAARKSADLIQNDVAKALGLTRSGYAFLEWANPEGRTTPSVTQIKAISALTGVDVDVLMSDESEISDILLRRPPAPSANRQTAPSERPQASPAPAGPDDRTRENFWRAVEFAVCRLDPALAPCFAVSAGPLGLVADFLSGRNVAEFSSRPELIRRHLGNLALVELSARKLLSKHLLIWAGDVASDLGDLPAQIKKAFGVTLHQVQTGEEAAEILLGLK
jgi:transcriptional regulator with XRE-family HTH domain